MSKKCIVAFVHAGRATRYALPHFLVVVIVVNVVIVITFIFVIG